MWLLSVVAWLVFVVSFSSYIAIAFLVARWKQAGVRSSPQASPVCKSRGCYISEGVPSILGYLAWGFHISWIPCNTDDCQHAWPAPLYLTPPMLYAQIILHIKSKQQLLHSHWRSKSNVLWSLFYVCCTVRLTQSFHLYSLAKDKWLYLWLLKLILRMPFFWS